MVRHLPLPILGLREQLCLSGTGTQAGGSSPLRERAELGHACALQASRELPGPGSWTLRIGDGLSERDGNIQDANQEGPGRRTMRTARILISVLLALASCLGRIGAATCPAQIQPGRRFDVTDREQHAGDSGNQDLRRQSVQGRCRHRYQRGAEIAVADGGDDAEQQYRSQRSRNDFGAVHPGTQWHPHRCSSPHAGEGFSDRPDAVGAARERRECLSTCRTRDRTRSLR